LGAGDLLVRGPGDLFGLLLQLRGLVRVVGRVRLDDPLAQRLVFAIGALARLVLRRRHAPLAFLAPPGLLGLTREVFALLSRHLVEHPPGFSDAVVSHQGPPRVLRTRYGRATVR
jgi:hypothetical protein